MPDDNDQLVIGELLDVLDFAAPPGKPGLRLAEGFDQLEAHSRDKVPLLPAVREKILRQLLDHSLHVELGGGALAVPRRDGGRQLLEQWGQFLDQVSVSKWTGL